MKSGEALKVWQKRSGTGKRHMKKVNVTEKVFEGLLKKSFHQGSHLCARGALVFNTIVYTVFL